MVRNGSGDGKYICVLMGDDMVVVPSLTLLNNKGEQWYGNGLDKPQANAIKQKLEEQYGEEFTLHNQAIYPLEVFGNGDVRTFKKIIPGVSIWGKRGLANKCSMRIKKAMLGCNANLHC